MADEIFKVIFQMEANGQQVLNEVSKVGAKYVETNETLKEQQSTLTQLQAKEAQLAKARANATNVNAVAKYNQELSKVRKQIEDTNKEVTKLSRSNQELSNQTNRLGRDISKAFQTTTINTFDREIKTLREDFSKLGKDGSGALGSTGRGVEAVEQKTLSLKAQLRILKAQLADTDDDKEFIRLSIEAGKLQDKIGDATDAARVFATDSPFEAVGNAIGSVTQKLLALDFDGAAQQSQLLVQATQRITFKGAIDGIGKLGTTLVNIGRSLLANPLFLIGAVIAAVVSNFDKLSESGGIVGQTLSNMKKFANEVSMAFSNLTDKLGLTNNAFIKINEQMLKGAAEGFKNQQFALKTITQILEAAGKDGDKYEKKRLESVRDGSIRQMAILGGLLKAKGKLSEEEVKQIKDLKETRDQAVADLLILDAKVNKKRGDNAKKYADDVAKIFDNLDKIIREQQEKTLEFNANVRLPKDSFEQIEALFALRKRVEDEALKEIEKNALKELKTKKDIETAKAKLIIIRNLEEINRENDKNKALLDASKALKNKKLDLELEQDEKLNERALADGLFTEEETAEAKLEIVTEYYINKIELLEESIKKEKELGFSTVESEEELKDLRIKAINEQAKAADDLAKLRLRLNLENLSEEERHELALFDINKIYQRKISEVLNSQNSHRLEVEIELEKKRLKILKDSGEATIQEITAQENKISELQAQKQEERREEKRKLFLEILDGIKQETDAIFSAIDAANQRKIGNIDRLLEMQQKQVDKAKDLAEKGNSELLELEQKRLDDLNKEKEKFVRRQQSLAVIELVTNSTIAIAKAAAQGGVAAPFTIAATLIALAAGLAQARSLASQAAFYEGGLYKGEGYTGDGNPREESRAQGKKPYQYHKQEFIFNHQKTQRYRNIFEDVHKGKIDLHDWQRKIRLYNEFSKGMNTGANVHAPIPIINNRIEIDQLKGQISELIMVVKNQETGFKIDEDGFTGYMKGIVERKSYIKNIARP